MKRRKGQPGGLMPPVRNTCTAPNAVGCKCPACTPAPVPQARAKQAGQTTVFFAFILAGLLLLTAVGIEIGRIVYARGEVGKAADAAALAAASRINIALYRETGEIEFLPDVYSIAQRYASMNSAFLRSRQLGVAVTGIRVDEGSQTVSVSVAADLSSLIPGILPFEGVYQVTGTAEARIDGR